jgi:large subunit ribosomal protein L10
MAISKTKKQDIVAKVSDIIKNSKSVVFVNFHKVSVLDATIIRKQLRGHGVGFYVAKKTLTKIALGDSSVTGQVPDLQGEVALVYGDDLLAPSREIYSFQKTLDGRISILGGIFENTLMNKAEMETIASIPPRKTLYAQLVNLINSPIQGLVLGLNAIAEKREQSN